MSTAPREIVFISKATPGDDYFALWLAPKLEAAGYHVFADVISLRAGDSWRQRLTDTLRDQAVKMLLCCKDSTLQKTGVQEEIGIACHVMGVTGDKQFIIPLRLEAFAPTFGLANTQFIDFKTSWAQGLDRLLVELRKAQVPAANVNHAINPAWEVMRRHLSVTIKNEPERLTSNWVRITEWPDFIRFVEVTGAMDHQAFGQAASASYYAVRQHNRGLLTFMSLDEVNEQFAHLGRFEEKAQVSTSDFHKQGLPGIGILPKDASNHLVALLNAAWETYAISRSLFRYNYSGRRPGFHIGEPLAKIGQKIAWGRQGDRRSSMLRNIAKGKVWSFGLTAIPSLWPFPHIKLKTRVMFSNLVNNQPSEVIQDPEQQFRLRRSVCKGWRNKQWHGRLMAYLEVLSGDSAWLFIPLGPSEVLRCEAQPLLFTSPVSTQLPNEMAEDDEEIDAALLGGFGFADETEEDEDF